MKKQSIPSQRDVDPESVKRRTELFTKLILPHKRLVYSICIKYTYDEKYIEDNYCEALVVLFRYIESYNPERPLKSWIYATTQRYMWELAKKRSKEVKSNNHIDVGSLPDELTEGGISCNCMGIDNYHELYNDDILEALNKLPEIHREALLLQQAGYKLDEIVEISYQNGNLASKNTDTIKSRIFLAKKNMKKLLTECGLLKCNEKYE